MCVFINVKYMNGKFCESCMGRGVMFDFVTSLVTVNTTFHFSSLSAVLLFFLGVIKKS